MSNNSGRALFAAMLATVVTTASASAHPGSHNTMSFTELAAHLTTGWHLAMLLAVGALATLVVVLANRRRQARAARSTFNRRSAP
ncbi:MAG: hypothetical protein AB7E81_12140 [Hyphomicrobiaceae bacterium]